MDAASLFSSANVHYVNEEYEEALKHYTCAVTLQDCAEYRSCRAAAYLKLGKFTETIEDAAQALRLDPNSHMALHWRGIALFYMGDFVNAKAAFEQSLRAAPHAKVPRAIWVRKCDAELSGSTLPLGGLVAEVSKAAPSTSASAASAAPAAPAAPVSAPTPAADAPKAAPAPAVPSGEVAAPEDHSAPVSGDAAKSGLTISGRRPVKREWYQNNTTVFVTIFAKGVQKDNLKVDFKEREMSVAFPLPGAGEEEYQLDLDLYDEVDPASCKVDVSPVKVEISLGKKSVGVQWKDLEKVEEVVVQSADQPAYPTSNKQKRNWSQIDKEVEQELKGDKGGGEDALNSLFKQIYERADDETRRAMNKSFQTSGGTVLSTNWGEVARADYEGKDRPTPPEGQEWRDWRKKD